MQYIHCGREFQTLTRTRTRRSDISRQVSFPFPLTHPPLLLWCRWRWVAQTVPLSPSDSAHRRCQGIPHVRPHTRHPRSPVSSLRHRACQVCLDNFRPPRDTAFSTSGAHTTRHERELIGQIKLRILSERPGGSAPLHVFWCGSLMLILMTWQAVLC